MKNSQQWVVLGLCAITAMLSLSGCIVVPERGGPYTYEHGDRVDHYGHRESRWCESHHDEEHCR